MFVHVHEPSRGILSITGESGPQAETGSGVGDSGRWPGGQRDVKKGGSKDMVPALMGPFTHGHVIRSQVDIFDQIRSHVVLICVSHKPLWKQLDL